MYHHHGSRYLVILIIVLSTLGLVGAALAAAHSAGSSVVDMQAASPQSQSGRQPGGLIHEPPIQSSSSQPAVSMPHDPVNDAMRLQAMAQAQSAASAQTGSPAAPLAEVNRVEFWNNPSNLTWIWGNIEPNSPVTITTSTGATLIGMGDENGDFSMTEPTFLYMNDLITATAGLGSSPVTIVFPDMFANSDSTIEQVIGHISYFNWELEIYPYWGEDMITTETDGDGNFWVTFQDIPPNGRGYLRFVDDVEPDTQAIFHRSFYDINPSLTVNYAHDWIEGFYDSDWQVAITVTNEAGDLIATAHGESGVVPYWGGDTGFATNYNVFWDGLQPDIQVSDFVYVKLERPGENHTAEVQVGEINGTLDTDADILTGSLNIPWLTDPVWMDCGVWIDGGPGMGIGEVDPNGGTYTCDFQNPPPGTDPFDILPGMDVGVGYNEPDADRVVNVFRVPAPDMRINLWGQGMPASGNNFVLEVHYNNDGWATAPGVTISQELWGMVYLSDTSGFNHTGTGEPGDPIIWEVGDVPVYLFNESVFYVFVNIVNPPGGGVFTAVTIDSSMDYFQGDPGRLYSSWESGISDNSESDLRIDKWAWTGDPAPGQDFVYAINACNNGSVSSSEVYITDTLHISTTLVSWWGQEPGWEAVLEEPHQLVVKRPTLSDRCSEVYVNVHLSEQAEQGMYLRNDACVGAESDPNTDNNCNFSEQWVGWPSYNLHIYPNWVFGQFVPGGEVGYELGFTNWGNMPMPGTVLTTTIPQGTEFILAYTWDWYGWIPVTPTLVGDGYLLWDYGTFPNGYNQNLGIRFKIGDNVPVGTSLVFENDILGAHIEQRYDDNSLVYTESVNEFGPNLRVDKHTNWYWPWEGQIQYELRIMNLGTTYLEDPVVVDSYPVSTTVSESDCWWNHGPFLSCEVDPVAHTVTYYLDYLNPGETASAMFNANLDPEDIGIQGLVFTNQADISDFGDIAPQDNHDEVTAYTGPDTFVRKWLKEGEVQAGREITYTVEFGNLNRWPWDTNPNFTSHITETLPEGTSFVRAVGYWDTSELWEPISINGQEVIWEWGPMWANQTWTFDLVVQIDNGVLPGTELLNTIEAWGDSPDDIDIDPSNNHFEYSLNTLMFRILMPFMLNFP